MIGGQRGGESDRKGRDRRRETGRGERQEESDRKTERKKLVKHNCDMNLRSKQIIRIRQRPFTDKMVTVKKCH